MTATVTMIRRLTAPLIESFAEIRANMKLYTKREKEMADMIKELMTEKDLSEFAPESCPYKLLLAKSERREVSWKDEWEKLAEKHWGKNWRKKQEELLAAAPAQPLLRLSVEPNT